MALMNRSEFLAAVQTVQVEAVPCPEMGGTVYVRALTLRALGPVAARQAKEPEGSLKGAAVLVAATLCGPDGATLFDPSKDDDIEALCDLPFVVVRRLSDAATALNGLGEAAVKDAAKN